MNRENEMLSERQSLPALAGEILRDTQKLFEQQVSLTKLQLLEDGERAKPFAVWLAGGLIALSAVSVLTAFTFVHLLKESTGLELWCCFAIVDFAFIVLTALCFYIAYTKLKGMSVLNG